MNITPRQQALIYRFLLGLVITEIPIVTAVLNQTNPDWRLLLIGLLGGLGAALEKFVAPQLVTTATGPETLEHVNVVPSPIIVSAATTTTGAPVTITTPPAAITSTDVPPAS